MLGGDSFRVIYENEELLVLHKPHDVPMDGEGYPVTVEMWASAYRAKKNKIGVDNSINRTASSAASMGIADAVVMTGDDDDDDDDDGGGGAVSFSSGKGGGKSVNCTRKMIKFVHQLDFATSGVLCVAFSKEMAARLAHCFEMRTTQKAYLAILRGTIPVPSDISGNGDGSELLAELPYPGCVRVVPLDDLPNARFIRSCVRDVSVSNAQNDAACGALPPVLVVDLPIGCDTTDPEGFRMAVDGQNARGSVTYVYVLQHGYLTHPSTGSAVPVTKVLLIPRTGRRHQLRVHCHVLGFPILGDVTYAEIPRVQAPTVPPNSDVPPPLLPVVAVSGPAATTLQETTTKTTTTTTNADTPVASQRNECKAADAGSWQRMMLHAWRLSFPVGVEPLRCGIERYAQKKRRRRETLGLKSLVAEDDVETWTHFEAEDPFQPLISAAGHSGLGAH